jgi:hypothetical protein
MTNEAEGRTPSESALSISPTEVHPGDSISFEGRCSNQFPHPSAAIYLTIHLAPADPRRGLAESGTQYQLVTVGVDANYEFEGEIEVPLVAAPGPWSVSLSCIYEDMSGGNAGPISINVVDTQLAVPAPATASVGKVDRATLDVGLVAEGALFATLFIAVVVLAWRRRAGRRRAAVESTDAERESRSEANRPISDQG